MGITKIISEENDMEKATKKRKKSRRLRRRIGLVAIGGLSLVLTVCLSVGATLAWFAGSTWASNDMYMGGPVYVEMAGRGHSGATAGGGDFATWQGGNGTLDILASGRDSGTAGTTDKSKILLPGQKLLIYSQARVFSTLYSDSTGTTTTPNQSSGANTTNSSSENGLATYTTGQGKIVSTTTSVLRAKFSINVEFDPYMGFNNFTDADYAGHYPKQSLPYTGEVGEATTGRNFALAGGTGLAWEAACGADELEESANGRRDAVETGDWLNGATGDGTITYSPKSFTEANLTAIKSGAKKSIYKWKYVSLKEYRDVAVDTPASTGTSYVRMGAPFDGTVNSAGGDSNATWTGTDAGTNSEGTGNGFYGVWVCEGGKYQESDAFYKARTTAYLKSYKEHYKDEYNRQLVLTVAGSLASLEDALNEAFVDLINESSDNIMAGNTGGFKVNTDTGKVDYNQATGDAHKASWLYVDPSISADTNAGDGASQNAGWWYLVANTDTSADVTTGDTILTTTDIVTKGDEDVTDDLKELGAHDTDVVHTITDPVGVTRANLVQKAPGDSAITEGKASVLNAKLFEIIPDLSEFDTALRTASTGVSGITKIVSDAFPFVNGDFELPGRELTNIFANAKISFQISFQALQAFLPYTPSIDGIASGTPITGTAKALNIGNAAPIFNEAFDWLTVL